MLSLLLAAAQTAPAPPAPAPSPLEERYDRCIGSATRQPAVAESEASQWLLQGGSFLAHQCLGIAYATEMRWTAAATEFELAARGAEAAKDMRGAFYWAQAGNAWLAAKDAVKARAALDAALSPGSLKGIQRGEAFLDRARAFFAGGDVTAARADLDRALVDAADDPLAWLLSATLARRGGDLPRAKADIAEALKRSSDDAAVQLEAGNIAASAGDEAGAKNAWDKAANLQPGSDANRAARTALLQFEVKP
ncbi:hypothetical protein Q5H94_19360 [Sphingomonas sp. CA1-15]|uniref:Tetratricopeptide repeat protein n=1 Tax=Sphingomonas immobilis TaxID=3063997 RepID=A0ABT9A3S6_9SPHN|nr:hypothetical protein [Sphingomonas sp. CA1-15]MDO7844497.1 hypothetical protein [Sphingomonas sp. CA1-15]